MIAGRAGDHARPSPQTPTSSSAARRPGRSTCSRWLRPKRVKSGMLSDSVAQKPIIAVSDGTKTGKNSPNVLELSRLREQRAEAVAPCTTAHHEQRRGHDQHERRGPVLDLAQQVHAAVDDEDVQAPEQQERQPLGRRCARRSRCRAEQRRPAGPERREERVQRLAADPGLDAEPAAGDERAHQRRARSSRWCRRPRARRPGRGCRTSCPGAS